MHVTSISPYLNLLIFARSTKVFLPVRATSYNAMLKNFFDFPVYEG